MPNNKLELASNPSTPPEILAELAKDASKNVRDALEDSLRTPSGVRRILAKNLVTFNDNQLEDQAMVVGLMVALELGYLELESAVSWADRAIEHLKKQKVWLIEISAAKSLDQMCEILRESEYYDSQLEAEFYIGLSCISWMGTPWLRESLSSYTFVDNMRLVFMDVMESDESYSELYSAMDGLASSPYINHRSIQRDENFIEAQKLCLQFCEKAKQYLSLFLN